MPNHCNNYLVLTHKDAREIGRAKLAILEGNLFQEFAPCPQDLIDTISGCFGDDDKQAELEAKSKSNLEKYGYANWYDWCTTNWGTKWDAYDIELVSEHYEGDIAELTLTFDTAWCPPIAFYDELVEQGFEVYAMYNEFGCAFCGIYEHGSDQYVGYDSDTLDNIPTEVDEQFGIRDTLAEWEAYEDEEESTEE